VADSSAFDGLTVADVMLRSPKTLPGSATVAEVRTLLLNPSVQIVLLADGDVFRGALTEIPDTAPDADQAIVYADWSPQSLGAAESASTAFEVAAQHPSRRVVVLDEENTLLGLVCLDESRTRFCGGVRIPQR
jgi:hypothetical protein